MITLTLVLSGCSDESKTTAPAVGGETIAGESNAGESSAGEDPAGTTPGGETPAGETQAGETPAGETPAGETPAGETPAGEIPAGETPAGETPAGETPAGETPAGEMTSTDDCSGYCAYLERCNSCLYNAEGECADQETCVSLCLADVPEIAASCIAGLTSCNEDQLTACYDQTIGDDDCANTCVKLEECGECFVDEETEECLTLAACAALCREVTPPAAASCIATVMTCDEIDACFD